MTVSRSDEAVLARRIVETIHEPLLVLDEALRVRQANPSFYRTFGTSSGETTGKLLEELAGGRWDIPGLRRRLEAVVEQDEAFERFEIEQSFPGIGRRVMRLTGRMLAGEDGESRRLLLAIDDVTERRELEEKLRHHARELERSNANLEQFAYAVSHDLQEPLRMVASYLQLLERRYRDQLDDEAREFIDYAVDGARRMKTMINGLLAYSRVGRKDGELAEFDLESVLDEVVDDLAARIEETEAEVTREGLPVVHGNRDQIRRVLQNLLENALTYHGDTSPRIHVSGGVRDDGETWVAVKDEGPGIPSDAQDRVFQIFQQLDPHGEGREGSGMGLALCWKIVERHDGRIWVDTERDEGCTVRFTLDLEPEETA